MITTKINHTLINYKGMILFIKLKKTSYSSQISSLKNFKDPLFKN